jgi:hypothetical protein
MCRVFFLAVMLAVFLTVSAGMNSAQVAEKKADTAKPISGLEWLVGGVWSADASKLGPGMRRIETRYQWSDNNAFIRFTTHFVSDKGTAKTYDGNFFWNPERSSLAIWYMDHANAIIEGPVTVDGDRMKIAFRAEDFDGKMGDMRASVIRKTNDKYQWVLEEKQVDGWKQLAALDYLRVAGS